MLDKKIIVLTPVKNEEWILERFLSVCSAFADHIIVADQQSADDSRAICSRYPKVHLIENKQGEYDEASRQVLLIDTARRLFPDDKRILLCFDADEILAADSMSKPGWQTMLDAEPGTILFFEKPDLYLTPSNVIRYNNFWPLGYVDDGVEHKPSKIHSIRIPQPAYAKKLYLKDIKIMHYTLTRIDAQNAKMMFYSMVEAVLNKNNFLKRRFIYKKDHDYVNDNKLEATPLEWFEGWEKKGIDMQTVQSESSYWYQEESLKLFSEHGYKKFWFDNIWNCDWRQLAKHYHMTNVINKPPALLKTGLSILDKIYVGLRKLKQ